MYRITEPLITFYQVVMRPRWGLLESGRGDSVWVDARPRFLAQVVGPHFETICREFAMHAPTTLFGDLPAEVGAATVADPARRTQIQIDVAVFAPAVPGEPRRVLSLGEAKWGEVIGERHVERLRRARDLLTNKGYDTRDVLLTCYGGAGFAPGLGGAAGDRVQTIGLEDLLG